MTTKTDVRKVVFVIVSEYAGEQGHIGGGDVRTHGTFSSFELAEKQLEQLRADHTLDYRDAHIVCRGSP